MVKLAVLTKDDNTANLTSKLYHHALFIINYYWTFDIARDNLEHKYKWTYYCYNTLLQRTIVVNK